MKNQQEKRRADFPSSHCQMLESNGCLIKYSVATQRSRLLDFELSVALFRLPLVVRRVHVLTLTASFAKLKVSAHCISVSDSVWLPPLSYGCC